MAHFHRVNRALLVGALLFLWCLVAFAEQCTQYTWTSNGSIWYDSQGAALSGWQSSMGASSCTRSNFRVDGGYFKYDYQCGCCESGTSIQQMYTRTGDYCQNNCPDPDTSAGRWAWQGATSGIYICDTGIPSGDSANPYCLVVTQRDISYQVDGQWQTSGPGKYTGGKCNGAANGNGQFTAPINSAPVPDSDSATRPTPECDGYFGQVNGVPTCVPKSGVDGIASTPTTSTSTTSSPSGTSSQSITKTTICEAGACNTTTVTTTIQNGTSSTVTNVTSKPIGEFCAENPKDKACGGSGGPGLGESEGSFGGTCQADFSCTGDAVSCAVALATNKLRCAFEATTAARGPYTSAVASGTPTLPNQEVEVSNSLFDTSDALGAAAVGVQDKTVTVMGTSVTLPFSTINPYLEMLGNLIVGISFLLAIRILIRG